MKELRRVMVIDDDVNHLLMCKLILERRGYDVLTLKDCEDLLEQISVFRPGLILMDYQMPGITGVEAIKLIKSTVGSAHVPVVLFSGRDDIEELAAMAGADDSLSKPFKLDDMVTMTLKYF